VGAGCVRVWGRKRCRAGTPCPHVRASPKWPLHKSSHTIGQKVFVLLSANCGSFVYPHTIPLASATHVHTFDNTLDRCQMIRFANYRWKYHTLGQIRYP